MNDFRRTPQLFFILGVIGLFVGLAVWVVFGLYSNAYYLGRMHAHFMIGIFLLSFIIGFLMTVIPRMTHSNVASANEIFLQLIPMLMAAYWGLFEEQEVYFFVSLIAAMTILFYFCALRIIKCRHVIPDVFPMVIISLLSGLSGAALIIFGYTDLGGRLFYLNMVLGLCVGVGARLIPMILRLGCSSTHGLAEMVLVGLLLTASCVLESYGQDNLGSLLRFVVLLWVFFRYWKVHHFSGFNSSVAWGVRVAAFSIVLGTMGLWLFKDFRLESLHLLYISGFGLLTLMVASRMILAHGNYDLSLENKNWFLKIPIALTVIATMTRISAVFVNGGYERHLGYSALMFLLAVVLWVFYFIPKLVLSSKSHS